MISVARVEQRRCTKGGAPRGAERRPEMPDADPFDLNRFVIAQAPVFAAALDELKAGRKRSHWMWFIFPQLRGLGHSSMADLVLALQGRSLHAIFGSPDDMKFRSSMTLFSLAARQGEGVFRQGIDRYCEGRLDERTVALCQAGAG